MARVCSRYWDNDSVVYWDPEDDTDGVKDGEGGSWNLEARISNSTIHCVALQEEHVAHLRVRG